MNKYKVLWHIKGPSGAVVITSNTPDILECESVRNLLEHLSKGLKIMEGNQWGLEIVGCEVKIVEGD